MGSWGSYPSIFAIGHRAIKPLLEGAVNVEEKVDGSQFSFGLIPTDPEDNIYNADESGFAFRCRSKGAIMVADAPESLFKEAVENVRNLPLHEGWTYRGECLKKPKHNSLMYDRVPKGNVIIFDINVEDGGFLSYDDKVKEAERLGLEVVPRLFTGTISNVDQFRSFLDTTSVLGGQKIEGVVVKPANYDLWGTDKKLLMGKFVSEAFKEVHRKAWGESNPTGKDIIGLIANSVSTQARWQKALLHLKEQGLIVDHPRDIGLLVKEIPVDIRKEEEENIKEQLFKWAWPHIARASTRGMAEWYKDLLMRQAFEEGELSPVQAEMVGIKQAEEVCDT